MSPRLEISLQNDWLPVSHGACDTLHANPLDRTCPSEATPWNYHARLMRVPPGEHTIMVEHENDEWHLEGGVVYEADVTVQ